MRGLPGRDSPRHPFYGCLDATAYLIARKDLLANSWILDISQNLIFKRFTATFLSETTLACQIHTISWISLKRWVSFIVRQTQYVCLSSQLPPKKKRGASRRPERSHYQSGVRR